MRYNSKLRFLRSLIGLVLFTCSFQEIQQASAENFSANGGGSNSTDCFKRRLSSILNDGKEPNPFDNFFGILLNADNLEGEESVKPSPEKLPSSLNIRKLDKHWAGDTSAISTKNKYKHDQKGQKNNSLFDWGACANISPNSSSDKLTLKNYQNLITQSFINFFGAIRKGSNDTRKKSYRIAFKEIVVPSLIAAVNNNELEGAARGILMNELLIETEFGKVTIPENRPDGLPSISFIGIENEVMPLHVIYIKESDRFSFKTFPNFMPPEIPKIAGQRLKEWVILKYKQIHDSLVDKSKEDLDSRSLLESLNNHGIYFAIEFKDDAVCYLSEVTRYSSNHKEGDDHKKNIVSRVSRILFSRLRPFIPFQSAFYPLEMTEFRSLSFIGSPILMNRVDNEDDLLTQQALFYWSIEAEHFLNDYKRKDHVCSEREIFTNTEYKHHCMISPNGRNPRNPSSYNNGFITTVSCFGLHPEGTMVLFLYKSLLSLRICQKNGSWSNIKVLSNQNRATVIFHKCHSRNRNKESFYYRVSTASIFGDN